MLDYFLYISIRVLSFLICLLPIEFSLFWVKGWGVISYYLVSKRAKICYLNLKLAFGGNYSPKDRKRITCEVFKNLAMNFAEILYFPKIDENYIHKYVKIVGQEKIDKVLSRKKGLIFLSAHFDNWELPSLVAQAKGYPMVVLARQQKFPRLNSLLNSFRQRLGAKVFTRGSMMWELLHSLRSNEVVGILGDQKAGTTGILVDFFNRLAWTPTGAITLSLHTGAAILPVFMIREKGPFHRIEIKDELVVNRDDYYSTLREFNRLLEEYIQRYPSQWLWFHRRWKASPNKNILILSDGKAGHLNQARAVAKIIEKIVKDKVATSYKLQATSQIVKTKVTEIKFRNKFTKKLMSLFGLCARRQCSGCLRCLKLCLEKNSYREVSSFYTNMVISCGSNLAALNLILAKENQAKSIILMKTGLIPIKKFDLAIVPAHDRPEPRKNVVITQAALNLIDEATMKETAYKLQATGYPSTSLGASRLQAEKRKIGVLIGGESKNYTLNEAIANTVVDQLLETAQDLDAQLLVTTSRRTPTEVDSLIKKRLLGNPFCLFLIIANEKNIEGTVAGILGLSDMVVVSGESISMISEALSSAKPVVVFEIGGKGRIKDTKHKRFLDNLINQNYLSLVKPEGLSKEIKRIYREHKPIKLLRDRELVSETIRKLF